MKDEISFDVIGDNKLQAGTITTIKNKKIDVDGTYKVISSNHTINGTKEEISVSVKKYKKQTNYLHI